MERSGRFDRAERIIRTGFWVNAVLMLMKLAAGWWGHSAAVFADGIESGCDFIAIFGTLYALRLGRQPFDERHPYGHGRAESLAAILVALLIAATGLWILWDAVSVIRAGHLSRPEPVAIGAALVTIVVKELLYRYSIGAGAALNSPALTAVAADHRKDALTSVATLVGVSGAFLGWPMLDPLAAALTSFFILHIGWQTFSGAAHDLMDGAAPVTFNQRVIELAEGVARVEHVHEIRTRRSGQYYIIDLKLDMDPAMTVKESHDVATTVKQLIFERFPNVGDVMIHINPHDEDHTDLIRL